MRDWHVHLIEFDGKGGNKIILPDIGVSSFAPAIRLSGSTTQNVGLPAATVAMLDTLGIDLTPWKHGMVFECDGAIRDVGLIDKSSESFNASSLSLTSLMGFFAGQPYRADRSWIGADPAALFRHTITHVQEWRASNIGIKFFSTYKTRARIGQKAVKDGDTGPYRLSWYDCQDVTQKWAELQTAGEFDYRLSYAWNADKTSVVVECVLQPASGRLRYDLRLVEGESVVVDLTPEESASDAFTDVWFSGSGEGSQMVYAVYSLASPKTLAKWKFETDKNVQNKTLAQQWVNRHATMPGMEPKIVEFQMLDIDTYQADSIQVGDWVTVHGDRGFTYRLKIVEIAWNVANGTIKFSGVNG